MVSGTKQALCSSCDPPKKVCKNAVNYGNLGETEIEVPQDRDGTFEPKVVKKHQKDISGFEVSDEMVSDITDRLLPQGLFASFTACTLYSFSYCLFSDIPFSSISSFSYFIPLRLGCRILLYYIKIKKNTP